MTTGSKPGTGNYALQPARKPTRLLDASSRHSAGLREWALLSFITRTGYGIYRLNTPPATTSSTSAADLNFAALGRDR
jgi:hypothetical protein